MILNMHTLKYEHALVRFVSLFVTWTLISSVASVSVSNTTIKVGILLMTNSTFPADLQRLGAAVDKGIEDVQKIYGLTLQPYLANYSVWCYEARYTSPGYMSELYYMHDVRAFIGPACSYAVQSAGRLAEYLRVPMVTGLGDLVFRNPAELDMFQTTVILSYNIRKLSGKFCLLVVIVIVHIIQLCSRSFEVV